MTNEKPTAPNEHQESTQKRTKISHFKRYISLVSFCLALLSLLVAASSFRLYHRLHHTLMQTQGDLSTSLTALKRDQDNNKKQSGVAATTIEHNQTAMQNQLKQLDQLVQKAMNERLYQTQDWLLLKARYLLELAQINTQWSDHYDVSIALLTQADTLLKDLSFANLLPVRQAIAQEQSQLKTTPTLDVAGILSQLDAIETRMNELTVSITEPSDENKKQNEKTSMWRNHLAASLNVLEKLVVIRHDDDITASLSSPLLESLLKETIRLNLQKAQWAVLNRNEAVYQTALKQARSNFKRILNVSETETAALIKQLDDLQAIHLTQTKPELGHALSLLNRVIKSKEQQSTKTNEGE